MKIILILNHNKIFYLTIKIKKKDYEKSILKYLSKKH